MPVLFAIADDLTGSLEVGAKFAPLRCAVITRIPDASIAAEALVLDTETRHADPSDAEQGIRTAAEFAQRFGSRIVYKKTDSTLRGNIAAELRGLSFTYPDRAIAFAPAYPEMGRTVRDGSVWLNGVLLHETSFATDALNPIRTSYVPDILETAGLPVILHGRRAAAAPLAPRAVHVFDAATEADLALLAGVFASEIAPPILCGTAALAGHLARALCTERQTLAWQPPLSGLVINGSRHETSNSQIQHAEACGWPVRSAAEILEQPEQDDWVILNKLVTPGMAATQVARRTGATVRDILARRRFDSLIVFGGDTAYGIVEALSAVSLTPICEVLPGMPLSKLGNLLFVTKAGGFGSRDALPKLRARLEQGT